MSTPSSLQLKYASLQFKNRLYYLLLAAGGLVVMAALYAVHMMEGRGHIITGMNNQIVWGMPHVFAIFLIVAASGVLNVASIGSVFGKAIYKARAPLASLLSIAMLAGGLAVLMLDLGRPDRFMLPAFHFNLTSVFAWNVVLYSGMFGLVIAYLWTMMERRMNVWTKPVGLAVFAWRFILTTGTGLIFAFLTARQAYGQPYCRRCSSYCPSPGGWPCFIWYRLRCMHGTKRCWTPRSWIARSICSACSYSHRCIWWQPIM
jgi:Ni/Fe-hydrogenase subunit HybB-like protein